MKHSSLFTTVISIAALLFIVGCKKKTDDSTPVSVTTIKGQAKAELNLTVAGDENIPDGTKITFLVNPNDLLNKPDTLNKYDSYRYTATVSSGQYTISVPARNDGSPVKIVPDEFEAQLILDNNGNTTRVVYSAPESVIIIYAGSTEIYDVNY